MRLIATRSVSVKEIWYKITLLHAPLDQPYPYHLGYLIASVKLYYSYGMMIVMKSKNVVLSCTAHAFYWSAIIQSTTNFRRHQAHNDS